MKIMLTLIACQRFTVVQRSEQNSPGVFIMEETKRTYRIGRTPDCLASHACVPDSNPADPARGFLRNNHVSPLST